MTIELTKQLVESSYLGSVRFIKKGLKKIKHAKERHFSQYSYKKKFM